MPTPKTGRRRTGGIMGGGAGGSSGGRASSSAASGGGLTRRTLRSSAGGRSLAASSSLRSSTTPPTAAVGELRNRIAQLESENTSLKSRLTELRRAGRATTIVKKAPTSTVLPRIPSARPPPPQREKDNVELEKLRAANKKLTNRVDMIEVDLSRAKNSEETALIKLENMRGALADKDARAREMGADIDRLTHEVQELRRTAASWQKRRPVQAVDRTAEIEDLQRQLAEAQMAASATAHIARVNEERARKTGKSAEAASERLKQRLHQLEADNDRLAKQVLELQGRVTAAQSVADAANARNEGKMMRVAVSAGAQAERIKELEMALKEAIARELALRKKFNDKQTEWQQMYKQWMAKAEAKISELNAVNQLVQTSLRSRARDLSAPGDK